MSQQLTVTVCKIFCIYFWKNKHLHKA